MNPARCDCMCGLVHPHDYDICEPHSAATERRFVGILGPIPVPMCKPCAEALDQLRAEFGRKEAKP